jgi:uncharacterized membrane protein YhfC
MAQRYENRPREADDLLWVSRRGAKIALVILHIGAAVAVLIELLHPFVGDSHAVERAHSLDFPASYAVYGFLACVLLVLLGRILRRLVMRDEDYYRSHPDAG